MNGIGAHDSNHTFMQIHKILLLFLKLFPIMLDLVSLFLMAMWAIAKVTTAQS